MAKTRIVFGIYSFTILCLSSGYAGLGGARYARAAEATPRWRSANLRATAEADVLRHSFSKRLTLSCVSSLNLAISAVVMMPFAFMKASRSKALDLRRSPKPA